MTTPSQPHLSTDPRLQPRFPFCDMRTVYTLQPAEYLRNCSSRTLLDADVNTRAASNSRMWMFTATAEWRTRWTALTPDERSQRRRGRRLTADGGSLVL